jgi:hypothetical protein
MFFKKFRIPPEVKKALPWTPYSTTIRLAVRYFAALNFTSSNKACIYITNKNILALGGKV